MITKITIELVKFLISTVKQGLIKGIGVQAPGKMCVEAAVCYAYGLPHDDNPPCVGSAVRAFKIRLNDCNWSSNDARAKGMLALSIAQLNSADIDQAEFTKRILLKIISTIVADIAVEFDVTEVVNDLRNPTIDNLYQPLRRLQDSLFGRKFYPAEAVYYALQALSSYNTGELDKACTNIAGIVYFASERKNTTAEFEEGHKDKVLNQAAQVCLDVLLEMKSPGCEFLYLINQ